MNWKLIFSLSLFSVAIAFLTVYLVPEHWSWTLWLPVFLICAWFIAKKAPGKYFMHGFMVAIFNYIWITAIHILLYNPYVLMNPDMAHMKGMPPYFKAHPRQHMLFFGPIVGIISGLVLGLFAWVASKIVKK